MQTGTLTENRMTVVEGWFAGKKYDKVPQPEDLPADFFSTFQASVAVNSSVSHCSELQTVVVCCAWHTLLSKQHVELQLPPDLCLLGNPLVLAFVACQLYLSDQSSVCSLALSCDSIALHALLHLTLPNLPGVSDPQGPYRVCGQPHRVCPADAAACMGQ